MASNEKKPNAGHAVPNPNGGWDVKKPGAKRTNAHTDTQQQAAQRTNKNLANDGCGEVRIHGRDGRIRESNTAPPSNNPYLQKG